ncbi:nucleotidyltransferase family protein [Nocardioides flavus (ex Wang et al. 2016)]
MRDVDDMLVPELVDAARFHRIAPLVHVAYRDSAGALAEASRADRVRAITMHVSACDALGEVSTLLADLDWVTFKGPVYSERAHPVPGLRSYNDVDVLLDPFQLRDAAHMLLGAGWRVADYQDMLRNEAVPGEMHWVTPAGVLVDLHWSMVNMASRRRLFAIHTAELLQRRVRVELGSDVVWTLDPVDALVHACVHASLAGANRLIYLIDVERLSLDVVDWNEVVSRAVAWRAQSQVALVLGRSHRVLGAPVPRDLDHRLGLSRMLQSLMAVTDRVAPVETSRRNVGLNKFVARAVRPSGPATAATVALNASRLLRQVTAGGSEPKTGRVRADRACLDAYLAAVESAARVESGLS